jgi:hypothetical protein
LNSALLTARHNNLVAAEFSGGVNRYVATAEWSTMGLYVIETIVTNLLLQDEQHPLFLAIENEPKLLSSPFLRDAEIPAKTC